jgi:hypothetical protein
LLTLIAFCGAVLGAAFKRYQFSGAPIRSVVHEDQPLPHEAP